MNSDMSIWVTCMKDLPNVMTLLHLAFLRSLEQVIKYVWCTSYSPLNMYQLWFRGFFFSIFWWKTEIKFETITKKCSSMYLLLLPWLESTKVSLQMHMMEDITSTVFPVIAAAAINFFFENEINKNPALRLLIQGGYYCGEISPKFFFLNIFSAMFREDISPNHLV